ncbi:ribokinase [Alicyclobacillus dauci]|uniref:Ribokinase n=1 Tax=Alicyclobacillus dauci TaxID=1475485 RepID=A0ABY6Z7Z9_9BACL|nr:ribokinase [Alicyclobacillus dauci]WAH38391.1 ribokinase [Alicyclobacillus dauci]
MGGILVVGSINMDVVIRVKHHPVPGETVRGFETAYHPGGKGANQAVAASRAGSFVRVFGAVGNDSFGETLQSALLNDDIDTQFVRMIDKPSGVALITVSEDGENTIIVAGGANEQLREQDLMDADGNGLWDGIDTLLVQNEISPDVTRLAMRRAHELGIHVVFNASPVAGITVDWIKHVDTLVVNETEAQTLADQPVMTVDEAKQAISRLLHTGPKSVIVTLGAQGAVFGSWKTDDDGEIGQGIHVVSQSAFDVPVVDTTAAGDTFVGALAAVRSACSDTSKALRFAAAASGLAVTKMGAQSSIPTRRDVEMFLAERK